MIGTLICVLLVLVNLAVTPEAFLFKTEQDRGIVSCEAGKWGAKCNLSCSPHCYYKSCEQASGACTTLLCEEGWMGPKCDQKKLACYCTECGAILNNTCYTDGVCHVITVFTIREAPDISTYETRYGCFPKDLAWPPQNPLVCKSRTSDHSWRQVQCCRDRDYCNHPLRPTLGPIPTSARLGTKSTARQPDKTKSKADLCPLGFAYHFNNGTPTGTTTTPYQASCYRFSADQENWLDARKRCLAMGGDLVSVETAWEQHHLRTIIRANSTLQRPALTDWTNWGYWTSGTDAPQEGAWRWAATGRALVYKEWSTGQPDNNYAGARVPENCMQLYRRTGYKWNDCECSVNFNSYICETRAVDNNLVQRLASARPGLSVIS